MKKKSLILGVLLSAQLGFSQNTLDYIVQGSVGSGGYASATLNHFTTCQSAASLQTISQDYGNGVWANSSFNVIVNGTNIGNHNGQVTIDLTPYIPITSVQLNNTTTYNWSQVGFTVTVTEPTTLAQGPAVTTQTINVCQNSPSPALTATLTGSGSILNWYKFTPAQSTYYATLDYSASPPTVSTSAVGTQTFYVSQSDASGCESARTMITVNVNALPTVNVTPTSTIECSANPIPFTAGGTAVSYTWSPNSVTGTTYTANTSGTYTVTGSTAMGCTATAVATLSVNISPTISVTNPAICIGNSTTLNASGASTYTWSTSATTASISITPTITTSYSVAGTSTNGCSAMAVSTVTVNPLPTVTVNNATVCANSAASLTASGASTYTWNTGAHTASIAPSPSATTVYTVTGANGSCLSLAQTATVTTIATPTVTVNSAAVCAGATATLTASGATTYTWNTTAITASISVTPSATTVYTVTGTGSNGCTNMATANVVVNALPNVQANNVNICTGGTATVTANGASTYTWSTGANTANIVVTPTAGITTYSISGTDGNGCVNTSTVSVSVNSYPTVSAAISNTTVCAGTTTTLTANGALTYLWSNGSTSANTVITPTASATYTVIGSNNGCNDTATVAQNVNPLPTASISAANTSLCAGDSTLITAASVAGATYQWFKNGTSLGAATANTTIYGEPTADYDVVVNDASIGCSNTSNTVHIAQGSLPAAAGSISGSASFCGGETDSYQISSVSSATSYSWSVSPSNAASIASGQGTTAVTINTTNQNFVLSVEPQNACGNGSPSSTSVSLNTAQLGPCQNGVYFAADNTNACTGTAVLFSNYTYTVQYGGLTPNWNFGAGATPATSTSAGPVSVTYSSTGLKTVTLKYVDPLGSAYGSATKTSYVNVTTCSVTGIAEVGDKSNNDAFTIYPNPTSSILNVDLGTINDNSTECTVYNTLGEVVVKQSMQQTNHTTINVSNLLSGVYFVRIGNSTQKFVKE